MTWLDDIKWDDKGLVPVIAQEKDSGDQYGRQYRARALLASP